MKSLIRIFVAAALFMASGVDISADSKKKWRSYDIEILSTVMSFSVPSRFCWFPPTFEPDVEEEISWGVRRPYDDPWKVATFRWKYGAPTIRGYQGHLAMHILLYQVPPEYAGLHEDMEKLVALRRSKIQESNDRCESLRPDVFCSMIEEESRIVTIAGQRWCESKRGHGLEVYSAPWSDSHVIEIQFAYFTGRAKARKRAREIQETIQFSRVE